MNPDKPLDPGCMADFDPASLPLEVARERILASIAPLTDIETVALHEASGRILAEAVEAPINVPAFRCSAMDGYAIRYADAIQTDTLILAGKSLAGHAYREAVASGHALLITTGARVPDDLDTVVMQEHTETHGESLLIRQQPERVGQFVREAGSNIKAGSQILAAGQTISASTCGLLGSLGITTVKVVRKPRVACFSTGDELIDPDASLSAEAQAETGMIHDANRPMLLSLVRQSGAEAIDLGICRDTPEALRDTLSRAVELKADFILSTGGVSVGEADHVRQVIEETGKIQFWKIAMKPGRPLMHGVLQSGQHCFGLPGNPVSGIVTFHQFVLPAITRLQGGQWQAPISLRASVQSSLHKLPGRVELQRGILSQDEHGNWQVQTTGSQDSHVLLSMQRANCYIVLPMASDGAQIGEPVEVIPFSGLPV